MYVSFLSNIMMRNLYLSTTGNMKFSILITGSCIFLREQKCTHRVFDFENLKPLSVAHSFCLGLVVIVARLYSYEWLDSI